MTHPSDIQPGQCVQCLRSGLHLTNGRCSSCYHRTPADLWRKHHPKPGVRLDTSSTQADDVPLGFRVLPTEEAERLRHRGEVFIEAAPIRRTEQISPRCTKYVYSDPRIGRTLMRVDLVLEEEGT